jgi:Tfp pilus assembly protein PilV
VLRSSPSSGFTIAEVLVALASIAVLLTGAAGLLLTASGSIRAARLGTTAALLAQQKVEQLRAHSGGLPGESGEDFLAVDGAPAPEAAAVFVRRWTVSPVPGTSGSTSVLVEVSAIGAGRVADVEAIFGQEDVGWP